MLVTCRLQLKFHSWCVATPGLVFFIISSTLHAKSGSSETGVSLVFLGFHGLFRFLGSRMSSPLSPRSARLGSHVTSLSPCLRAGRSARLGSHVTSLSPCLRAGWSARLGSHVTSLSTCLRAGRSARLGSHVTSLFPCLRAGRSAKLGLHMIFLLLLCHTHFIFFCTLTKTLCWQYNAFCAWQNCLKYHPLLFEWLVAWFLSQYSKVWMSSPWRHPCIVIQLNVSDKKKHCEPLVAVWLRPSTTGPCICCKQAAEKPRGEHLKMMYVSFFCKFTFFWHMFHKWRYLDMAVGLLSCLVWG